MVTYYKQQSQTDCLLACVETITQTPRAELFKWIEDSGLDKKDIFYRARFFKYLPCLFALKRKGVNPVIITPNLTKTLFKESVPMIIGIGEQGKPYSHAILWDTERLFDPYRGFLNEKLEDLTNILYAIVCYAGNPIKNQPICHPEWYCWAWDQRAAKCAKDKNIDWNFEFLKVV